MIRKAAVVPLSQGDSNAQAHGVRLRNHNEPQKHCDDQTSFELIENDLEGSPLTLEASS